MRDDYLGDLDQWWILPRDAAETANIRAWKKLDQIQSKEDIEQAVNKSSKWINEPEVDFCLDWDNIDLDKIAIDSILDDEEYERKRRERQQKNRQKKKAVKQFTKLIEKIISGEVLKEEVYASLESDPKYDVALKELKKILK
jgi:hypothetical protein